VRESLCAVFKFEIGIIADKDGMYMFEIILLLVKVVFTLVIYLFILGVIRLIYLDIKSMSVSKVHNAGFIRTLSYKPAGDAEL